MKKIIIIVLTVASLASCKKANYWCYDQVTDNQGNVTPGTTGLVKKHFTNEADLMQYQHTYLKCCVEHD